MKKQKLTTLITLILLLILIGCKEKSPVGPSDDNSPSTDERVEMLLAQMTLDEKIGQMTQAERGSVSSDTSTITTYCLGSILSGGGSAPSDNSPQGWADMYDLFQRAALRTRLKIPIIYGIDAVHGHNNVRGAVIFPHNIGLGCTNNPDLVEQVEHITAEEVAGTGIDWTFGPCIAVPQNERWGRTYEGFSESPDLTKLMAAAAVRGFQGVNIADGRHILACAKHFLGDGGTANGVDQGNTVADEPTMRRIYLPGYEAAVQAGVGSVMASYNSWNGVKMHSSSYWMNDVLKGELGFKGFVVSDWEGIGQLPGDRATQIETAINAGIDMAMEPSNFKNFISTLKELVSQNRVSITRIDDAVRRILRKKFELGLFENPFTDRSLTLSIGSSEHRAVAREAVRQSLVLLKNDNKVLPLSKGLTHIHVAGKSADNIGNQCGGWTIYWQGYSGNITTGTTVLQAIKNTVSQNTTVAYSSNGSGATGADVGIVVIGETPYAEYVGDRSNLSISKEDTIAIGNIKSAGIPTIVILISGRPMILGNTLTNADAFIAAWLPGTEGQGVADVLFGDYNPTGKLSYSWPWSMSQIPINVGDANYDPLFPYGFGLSY
jgi:beta-glucosidase